jgi:hypothetical protein
MPVGFIKIDDQMYGRVMIGSDHIRHEMRAFLVVEERLPLGSCPPKLKPKLFRKFKIK